MIDPARMMEQYDEMDRLLKERAATIKDLSSKLEQTQKRLNWAANELLACDYGDNGAPGEQVGWHVYGWRHRKDGIDRRIYGTSIDIAIDAELTK